ncbi:MAG TPA: hypothetical protein PLB01_00380, partial [Thermoanaerobaculia bacterium]|nr:hypothetical protein [Thermoanaerobaculia bacterium]
MLNLVGTSAKLRVTTSAPGTIAIHCQASWMDNLNGGITPGATNTASITSATTTDIVASPATAGTTRNVKGLSIANAHATNQADVDVIHTDGTNALTIFQATLAPGEVVIYSDLTGWVHFNSAGTPLNSQSVAGSDAQSYTLTSQSPWTKPTSFTPKFVAVWGWGAGGGGGAGASLATATIAKGGAGGGGGAYNLKIFLASELGA